jgi:hypothetical protein
MVRYIKGPQNVGHDGPSESKMISAKYVRTVGFLQHKRSVTGDLATVDVQDLPGDVRRFLQEQDAVHDVADLADAP